MDDKGIEEITVKMTLEEFKKYLRYKDCGKDFKQKVNYELKKLRAINRSNEAFCVYAKEISDMINNL